MKYRVLDVIKSNMKIADLCIDDVKNFVTWNFKSKVAGLK